MISNAVYSLFTYSFSILRSSLNSEKGRFENSLSQELLNQGCYSQIKIEIEFQDLLKNTRLLMAVKDPPVTHFQTIQQNFKNLIEFSQENITLLNSQEEQLVSKIKRTINGYSEFFKLSQEYKNRLNEMKAQLEKFITIKSQLGQLLNQYKSEIKFLQDQVNNIKLKREEGVKDLFNPFGGMADGFKTGNYYKIIPFYSTALSIISVINQDKENLSIPLKQKREVYNYVCGLIYSAETQIIYLNESLNQVNNEISRLSDKTKSLDVKIQKLGQNITSIKNFKYLLLRLESKYQFLTEDLENLKELIKEDLLEPNTLTNFVKDILDLREKFI